MDKLWNLLDRNELDDWTLILADLARKALAQIHDVVEDRVRDRMAPDKGKELIASLTEGRWTHDYPITFAQAPSLGLPVRKGLPSEVSALMELYPQPRQARPVVGPVRAGAVSPRAGADDAATIVTAGA